ncbi:MAG TPA: response regulator, partial [Thermodesulfovibrionales bacterium]|nr:response regulator [Thermodesulfovibrionales bacterium]
PQFPDANTTKDRILLEDKTVQRGKVLIVDDEIDIVNTLQAYLSEKGYKTLGCTSAKGAIDTLKKCDFDILLIDLMMPEMNGIELLKSALKVDPHLIGMIITGKGTIQSAVDAMKAGAFDYLLKPFEFALLSPILTRAMKVRELRKSEERYRILVDELTHEVRKLQNDCDKPTGRELDIFELKEETEALKEALRRHKEMYHNFFFNGGCFDQ